MTKLHRCLGPNFFLSYFQNFLSTFFLLRVVLFISYNLNKLKIDMHPVQKLLVTCDLHLIHTVCYPQHLCSLLGVFCRDIVAQSLVFCEAFCKLLSFLSLLFIIVLSVRWFTAFSCPFGIFKQFFRVILILYWRLVVQNFGMVISLQRISYL